MNSNLFIVSELSGNHNGDIKRAFKLIEESKKSGADAVKLQTYTADTITINHDGEGFMIHDGPWKGYKLYDLYNEAHTPWEWHEELFKFARDIGIVIFSTPFDETAVDFLEKLNCPIYKVASFEIIHIPLIKYIASIGKPMIISTGMASMSEIEEAVDIVRKSPCNDLTLLHCISSYPAPIQSSNLSTMVDLKKRFPDVRIGLSDHSMGTTVSIAAVALGATVVEKHVTLSRDDGGVDALFSLEPSEFKVLCTEARLACQAIGSPSYERSEDEKKNMIFRRSIYVVKDIKAGEKFTTDNIKIIRPGNGLKPKYYEDLLDQVASKDYSFGTPLN